MKNAKNTELIDNQKLTTMKTKIEVTNPFNTGRVLRFEKGKTIFRVYLDELRYPEIDGMNLVCSFSSTGREYGGWVHGFECKGKNIVGIHFDYNRNTGRTVRVDGSLTAQREIKDRLISSEEIYNEIQKHLQS